MKKFLGNKLILGVASLLIGLVMVLVPGDYINIMLCIAGVILLIGCAVRAVMFVNGEKSALDIIMLIPAVLAGALGLLFVFSPKWITDFAFVLFGIVIILVGVYYFVHAIRVKNVGKYRFVLLGVAAVIIILGLVVTFNATKTAEWIVRLSGIGYLVAAVHSFMALAADAKAD